MPLISVIVPVFNAGKYISRCIESILKQTFTDYELILVDDGSSDNSGDICDQYALLSKQIRVIHQQNQGQSIARNVGIANATGQYICFIDADDFVHSQLFSRLYESIQNNSIVCCATKEDDFSFDWIEEIALPKTINRQTFSSDEEGIEALLKKPYICWTVWGKLIPTRIVKTHLFEAGRYYEDNAIILKWIANANRITVIEDILYYYQKNNDGTTKGAWSIKKDRDFIWSQAERLSFFVNQHMFRLFDSYYTPFLFNVANSYYKYKKLNRKYSRELKKQLRTWWRKYSKHAKISRNQKQYVFSVIYPIREALKEWSDYHIRGRN